MSAGDMSSGVLDGVHADEVADAVPSTSQESMATDRRQDMATHVKKSKSKTKRK